MKPLKTNVVTISGLPGSGTTTAAKLLETSIGLPYRNTGAIFREMAQERGMELIDFGHLVESDPSVDKELDRRQEETARNGDVILEGRLAGWVLKHANLPGLAVWVDAPLEVRVQRVSGRDEQDPKLAAIATAEREETERRRYLKFYGFDLADLSIYDLVLDSSKLSPEAIVDAILKHLTGEE